MPRFVELAPPVLAPPELVAVQMLLLYAPPEPVICCHVLPVACCCAIAVLAPPELALLASPELTPYSCDLLREVGSSCPTVAAITAVDNLQLWWLYRGVWAMGLRT